MRLKKSDDIPVAVIHFGGYRSRKIGIYPNENQSINRIALRYNDASSEKNSKLVKEKNYFG